MYKRQAGNFFLTKDAAAKYGYETIRYLMIQAHYRMPMNYTAELLESCRASLDRLYNCKNTLKRAIANAGSGEPDPKALEMFSSRKQQFIDAMDDDLNTADGVAAVFELVKDINTKILDKAVSKNVCETAAEVFDELCGVLGILYNRKSNDLDAEVEALIAKRQEARANKDWAAACLLYTSDAADEL